MKDVFIKECLILLKRNDIKETLKELMQPIIENLLIKVNPYIYLSLIFVFISFLLHLGIFLLLIRRKTK